VLLDAGLDLELARCTCLGRGPANTGHEGVWVNAEATCDFDQRVDARDPRPSLQQTDLGPVKRAAQTQRFLGYASPLAESAKVLAEPLCDLHYSISNREK
jgi:hypothetical protein